MGSARGSKSQYSHDESCDSAFGMDAKIANRSNSSGHPSPPAVARLDFLWEVDVVAAGYHIHLPHSDYESSRIFEKPFKHLFAGVARGMGLCPISLFSCAARGSAKGKKSISGPIR